ncbi:MAG: hypothetical protein QG597_3224 [Actinomycetota bacterium]|nr:hypothetical protein [Actinomycetota bacterium]
MSAYDDEPDVGLRTLAALIAELIPGQVIVLDSWAPAAEPGEVWRISVGRVFRGWLVDLSCVGQPEVISFPGQLLLRDAGFSSPTDLTSTGPQGSYQLPFDYRDVNTVARTILAVHEHVFGLPHPWLFTEVRAKSFLTGVQPPCLHALTHRHWAA